MSVCKEDCLRCPYPDCILDAITPTAYAEVMAINRVVSQETPFQKERKYAQRDLERRRQYAREYRRQYYVENRGEILAQGKLYRAAHKDDVKNRRKSYYEAHKEEIKAKARAYYALHKVECNAKSRERRRKKKAATAALQSGSQ